jgi:hypothetical protein
MRALKNFFFSFLLEFGTCIKIMETESVKIFQTVYTTIMCLSKNTNKIDLQAKIYNQ